MVGRCIVPTLKLGIIFKFLKICPMRWRDEIEYWRIPITALADCCRIVDALTPSCKRIGGGGGFASSPSPLSLDNVCFFRFKFLKFCFFLDLC